MRYELNFIANNERLYEELNRQTYEIGRSTAFCVRFPKVREVFAADFRDRIVHHLVVNRLGECFEQEMLDCAYACRKGKGVLYGVCDVQRQMAAAGALTSVEEVEAYDFEKFYPERLTFEVTEMM